MCECDVLIMRCILSYTTALIVSDSMCPHIPDPENGQIVFTPDKVAPFVTNTTATYSCDPGHGLVGGDAIRTCRENVSSGEGMWSGMPPSCKCKCFSCTVVSNILYSGFACLCRKERLVCKLLMQVLVTVTKLWAMYQFIVQLFCFFMRNPDNVSNC